MVDTILHWPQLSNIAYRLISVTDSKVWDKQQLTLSDDVSFADSLITLTKDASSNGFEITLPIGLLEGEYDLIAYNTISPTATTAIYKGIRFDWDGDNFNERYSG